MSHLALGILLIALICARPLISHAFTGLLDKGADKYINSWGKSPSRIKRMISWMLGLTLSLMLLLMLFGFLFSDATRVWNWVWRVWNWI